MAVPLTAAAGPPEPVSIEGPSDFGEPGFGEFTATGLPECASGTFVDVGGQGNPSHPVKPGFNIQIYRQFTCDGSGHMFYMKLQVRVDNPLGTPADETGNRFPTFSWLLLGGDGPFDDLHMNGRGFAAGPIFEDDVLVGVYDVYTGKIH